MRLLRPRSLKWRLVGRIVVMQAGMLILLIVVLLMVLVALWRIGIIANEYEGGTLNVLRDAIDRDADGRLVLRPTADLAHLRAEVGDLWFVIRDRGGRRLSEGAVPDAFADVAAALDHISEAELSSNIGETPRPTGLVRWSDTAAGQVQILTGTGGSSLFWHKLLSVAPELFLNLVLPIAALMGLATLVATPFVVRRAMAGLRQAAAEAEGIDIDRRGVRLSTKDVPTEITPLVKAVNDALGRLDNGYERQGRFLADAAHELRTPIAILNARLASLPAGADKTRLLEDATRLSVLTGQLLDLQRLDHQPSGLSLVDLIAIAKRVVVDLAPLAFAAGYDMAFEAEPEVIPVKGDQTSLERALTNLVQNAIDHGGRCGTIRVRVVQGPCVEVCDEGNGIPVEEREQIFEPFHRLRQDGNGAGLGLNLVQKIMHLHGGRVEAVDGASAGARLRMVFPKAERLLELG